MTLVRPFIFFLFCAVVFYSSQIQAKDAKISVIGASSERLGLRVVTGEATPPAQSTATAAVKAERIAVPVSDSLSRDAFVVCFYCPNSKKPQVLRSQIQTGNKAVMRLEATESAGLDPVTVTEPVQIRGRWLSKVIIAAESRQADGWHDLVSAEVQLAFAGEPEGYLPMSGGPLDEIIDDLVVNSDEAARWWGKPTVTREASAYNPFAQSSNWVRIAILEDGIYRITRNDLTGAGVDVGNLDPRTLRMFHAGGKPLPKAAGDARDSLVEIAITIPGEEDGSFDTEDAILFFAQGGDFWSVDSIARFVRHPYSDRNVYYLAIGGSFPEAAKRMETVSGQLSSVVDTVTRYNDYLHFEEEAQLASFSGDIFDYYNWYWGLAGDISLFVNLPQPASQSVNRFRIGTRSPNSTSLPVFNLTVNNFAIDLDSVSNGGLVSHFTSNRFTLGLNQINLDYVFGSGYTDYVEIELERTLTLPATGQLMIYGRSDGEAHSYRVNGTFESPLLLDISDRRAQRLISPVDQSGSNLYIDFAGSDERQAVLAVSNGSAFKTPFAFVATQIDDLRASTNGADYIVIAHDNFYASAQEYANYRQEHDQLRTRVVRISDVYAQFAGGRVDPIAIRDFLRFAHFNWSGAKPSYCLLVGDGVYDFRNNLGTGGINYVPPYVAPGDETVSDENFVYLDEQFDLDSDDSYGVDRGVDMVIARWAVKSTAEFQAIFDKMKSYDLAEDAGNWRNILTIIADDENHPESSFPEIFHTEDSEELAREIIPASYVLDKIYGISYPYGAASEKPEMREAIIRAINDGRLIVNYTGHGNPNLWADERIFRRVQDIPRLNNADRLPLIFNASCSIGFFDDPSSEGMAEDLLRFANGGAVGTISATRLVYSRPNFEFNKAGMTQLLGDKNYTIAEAVYVTKLLRQGIPSVGDNDRKYIYIGDPLTRLAVAPNAINFTGLAPDSLVALTVTELAGQIEDKNGVKQNDFAGTATVSVFDNQRTRTLAVPFGNTSVPVSYVEYGPEIYRGRVDVTAGEFDLKFVVPKDITYGGREARINGYAASASSGASGVIYPIAIGSINKDIVDSLGPEVSIFLGGNPAGGSVARVGQNAEVTVELFDSLGINLTGEIGHALELTIDDLPEFAFDLTDSFVYNADSYQEGSAKFTLPNLTNGDHRMKVKAWDSANNSTLSEVDFSVNAAGGIAITEALCYPNPVKSDCEFSYVLSDDAEHVILKLFTLSGREIWSKSGLPTTRGAHQGIYWDGRDADGDRLANGVYLYQLSARAASVAAENDDNNKAVATGKLVVLK